MMTPLVKRFLGHRFGGLLASQILLLLAAGFTNGSAFREETILLALLFMQLGSGLAIVRGTAHARPFLVVAVLTLASNLYGYFSPLPGADIVASAINLVFMVWVQFALAGRIFMSGRVDENVILGSACLYIHTGMLFGFVYLLLDYFVPHSFSMATPLGAPDQVSRLLGHFLYYSFVTLGTVGYGDIAPISAPARYVSVTEALMGQLYLAIMVARLVGLHLSERK